MLIAAVTGWAATLLLCTLHARARRRLVLVARASHELRGPLCAARLAVETLAGEPARVAAIDHELRRAARALEDLAAAPAGDRARGRRELVDVRALVAAHAPAWEALAAAYGAELHLESVVEAARSAAALLSSTAADPSLRASPRLPPTAPGPSRVTRWTATARRRARTLYTPADAGRGAPAVSVSPAVTAVAGDPVRIAQAAANLVANAAEHGGGPVRLRVTTSPGSVRLEVSDDGPGLPAPVAVLVAAARSRRGRRGHGLAIAAAVADDHGGRLTAAPSPAGARLILELPAAAAVVLSRGRAAAPPEIVA